MSDRETIESALQRVQSGELSPAEATQLLLAAQQSDINEKSGINSGSPLNPLAVTERGTVAESLPALVERLGAPPSDVIDNWSMQLLSIASNHEQLHVSPLPSIDLADCSLDQNGDLAWKQFVANRVLDQSASSESITQINRFRQQLDPNSKPLDVLSSVHDATPESPETSCSNEISSRRVDSEETSDTEETSNDVGSPSQIGARVKQGLLVSAVLACCVVGGSVIYNAMQPEVVVAEKAPADIPQTFNADVGELNSQAGFSDRALPSTDPIGFEDIAVEDLETFESMSEAELASFESAAAQEQDTFSLNDLMPPTASFVPKSKPDEMETVGAAQADSQMSNEASDGEVSTSDQPGALAETDMLQKSDDDSIAPAESLQETRKSSVMSVELNSIDRVDVPTQITEENFKGLNLEFPFNVPLELSGDSSPWEIRDARKKTLVGRLLSDSEGTRFNWSETARQSPSVSSFAHGRFKDQGGSMVYLRPTIVADAWPLRTDRPDVMPTWNLGHPIPPKVSRIQIDFDLPEDIEIGWIEPIESDAVRRSRGLAVLTPRDGETVSLGVRLDVRCSRKLTVRVRFAGRLDSSMPWQVVSGTLLAQFANQLNQQAILVSNEKARLASVYAVAGTSGRRILRVKQDRNDDRADMIRQTSERVAELQALLSSLSVEGFLRANVWVEWPDVRQELLVMSAEE